MASQEVRAARLARVQRALEALAWDENEDPLERLIARSGWPPDAVVRVSEGLRVPLVLQLAARVRCRAASEVLGPLRAVEDDAELAGLAVAAARTDLVKVDGEPLAAGIVHSAEPGVCLPDRFGVRILDIVGVEAAGARRLHHAPIDLRPCGARA